MANVKKEEDRKKRSIMKTARRYFAVPELFSTFFSIGSRIGSKDAE